MKQYRKKDVINNEDINAFETIEINKIKTKIQNNETSIFFRMKWKLVLPVVAIILVLGVALSGGEATNPALEDIKLAEINTISLSDLPSSLRGAEQASLSNFAFLGTHVDNNPSLVFDDQVDVTGEGQQRLTSLIEEQTMKTEAEKLFNDLYQHLLYLELDEASTFDEVNEYYFTVNEDGTYVLTLRTTESDSVNVIELKTYYEDEELFYQATLEVTKDSDTSIFQVNYNEANTVKNQYVKFSEAGEVYEQYISLLEDETSTKVVAIGMSNGNVFEVVADANDEHGVIFSSYTTADQVSITSTEYYDGDGALLKQEEGFDRLDIYDEYLDQLFTNFDENPDINIKNLSDLILDFNDPEEFEVTISLANSALAKIQEVPATLEVDDLSYDIDYSFSDLLYSKKEESFTSGDTLYHITDYVVTDTDVVISFGASYQIPEKEIGADGQEYYVNNKYMAKYIEAAEGFSIVLDESSNYKLVNNSIIGEIADRIEIDIKAENYFVNGELTEILVFQHTCDIQFENVVFTKIDTINAAKVNLRDLYEELIPSTSELDSFSESIDVSMFE